MTATEPVRRDSPMPPPAEEAGSRFGSAGTPLPPPSR